LHAANQTMRREEIRLGRDLTPWDPTMQVGANILRLRVRSRIHVAADVEVVIQGNRTYHPSKNKKVHTAARRYFHSLGFCDAIEICKNKIKT
jgi:hypothetical protein